MAIPITDTGIIRTDTTDPTTATIMGRHTTGTMGTVIGATTVIIITTAIGTKLT
jgi:hypothetical protein